MTLGRCFMPGSILSERLSAVCPIDLETFSRFGPACHPVLASSCMTTPQRTFRCLVHSRFPDRSGCPVQPSRLFFPLSTCVYQSHAEGRGCLPFTGEAGVVPPNGGLLRYRFRSIIDLHGYAVTKVKRPSPPSPYLSRQFRANRSHTMRSKKQLCFLREK